MNMPTSPSLLFDPATSYTVAVPSSRDALLALKKAISRFNCLTSAGCQPPLNPAMLDEFITLLLRTPICTPMRTLETAMIEARSMTVRHVISSQAQSATTSLIVISMNLLDATEFAISDIHTKHNRARLIRNSIALIEFAGRAASWSFHWSLHDYRTPERVAISCIERLLGLLHGMPKSQTAAARSIAHLAHEHIVSAMALAVADTYASTPNEIHLLADAIRDASAGVFVHADAPQCSGPYAVAIRRSACIQLMRDVVPEDTGPYVSLAPLLESLDRHICSESDPTRRSVAQRFRARMTTQRRQQEREAAAINATISIGFFAILARNCLPSGPTEPKAIHGEIHCKITDHSDTGVRVKLLQGVNVIGAPRQVVALENPRTHCDMLGIMRWIKRHAKGKVELGIEYLSTYSVELVRSQDTPWPSSGLRVQRCVVAGLDAPSSQSLRIRVYIGSVFEPLEIASIPRHVDLADHNLSLDFTGECEFMDGCACLVYTSSTHKSPPRSSR